MDLEHATTLAVFCCPSCKSAHSNALDESFPTYLSDQPNSLGLTIYQVLQY